jgi:hypothetical protein
MIMGRRHVNGALAGGRRARLLTAALAVGASLTSHTHSTRCGGWVIILQRLFIIIFEYTGLAVKQIHA